MGIQYNKETAVSKPLDSSKLDQFKEINRYSAQGIEVSNNPDEEFIENERVSTDSDGGALVFNTYQVWTTSISGNMKLKKVDVFLSSTDNVTALSYLKFLVDGVTVYNWTFGKPAYIVNGGAWYEFSIFESQILNGTLSCEVQTYDGSAGATTFMIFLSVTGLLQ